MNYNSLCPGSSKECLGRWFDKAGDRTGFIDVRRCPTCAVGPSNPELRGKNKENASHHLYDKRPRGRPSRNSPIVAVD